MRKAPYKAPHQTGGPMGDKTKIAMPKNMLGKTAKKPENDDRPLKHGRVAKKHKLAQRLQQTKI